jgi:hypothetical protein
MDILENFQLGYVDLSELTVSLDSVYAMERMLEEDFEDETLDRVNSCVDQTRPSRKTSAPNAVTRLQFRKTQWQPI